MVEEALPLFPTLFIGHGGGPNPLLKPRTKGSRHMAALSDQCAVPPQKILVVSAHWEETDELAVTSAELPSMLFDYYGFPPETYKYQYPARGDAETAQRVASLLGAAGIPCHLDPTRGFDHGVFVPLMLAWPNADVPVVCLSLHASLDAAAHIQIGAALRPLRAEGVLIIGSGNSFHNMREKDPARAAKFNAALTAAVCAPPTERAKALVEWEQLEEARFAHPRPEHLLPLHVVAGAAQCLQLLGSDGSWYWW